MKHLIIIGARGWGREVYATAIKSNEYLNGDYDIKGFLDDDAHALDGLNGIYPPILGPVEDYKIEADDVFFCAMGESNWRKHYAEIIEKKGGEFIPIIHATAKINQTATVGGGSIVTAYSIVSADVKIGRHVMIQSFSDIGHDAVIDDYASIGAYVFLGGYASVGEMSTMYTKSSIIPHKSIGKNCVVGFGSVVMRNVKDGNHVLGNPAKKIEL